MLKTVNQSYYEILLQFQITVFNFSIFFLNIIYFCDQILHFSQHNRNANVLCACYVIL